MFLRTRFALLLVAMLFAATTAQAQNAGQDKLDAATDAKIDAESRADLAKVIELCEQAIELGLDEGNTKLAKQVLAASALQRAQMTVQQLPKVANNPNGIRNLSRETKKDLEKAVANDPQLAEAFILLAKLETLPGGSREKSIEYINQAIEVLDNKPVDQSSAYMLRAGLQEDNDAKLADLSKALEVNSTNNEALQAKIALQLALGKLEEVVQDAEQMLAKDEDNLFAFEAAIRAMVGLEKNDEVIALLTKRIEKDGSKGVFYRIRAQMYLLKEQDEEAMADLDKAIELDRRDAEALIMRGRLHYLNEDIEKANRDISDALLIAPDSVQGVLMRGLVAAQEKRYGDAIVDMELLVRADPNNLDWIMQLASYYQMDDRPRLAIRLLDELVKKDGEEWRALRLRGDAKLSIGEHKDAVADYDDAITILEKSRAVAEDQKSSDLDYSGLLNNLSWVLSTSPKDDLRDGKKALDLALKACEATEYKAAHILSTLAAAYAETGDFEKAKEWSAKCIELATEEDNPQLEQLKEELESYKNNKPWREEQETEENDKPLSPATETIDT
jgi:tetratricopeptide (TPR) repeat protein